MNIDWFTFAAQIVNFLVLVALLRRFLYRPILRAMDQREQQIAQQVRDAEQTRREAEQEAERYRDQQQQLEHQRETLWAQAGQEVELWRREQLRETREEVDHARQEWLRSIHRQRSALLQELGRRATGQVLQTARAVLARLASAELEQQIVDAFLMRITHLQPQERHEIAAAMDASHHRITVASGFELSGDQQTRIRSAIHRTLSDRAEITFHTSEDLICGVELRSADHKIAWNVQWLLQDLEEEFVAALDSALATEPEHPSPSSTAAREELHAETSAGSERTP